MSTNRGAYLMARITSHGLQVDTIFGGKPELEKMDVAAACTGLSSLDYHLVMAKYCDDVRSAIDAAGELDYQMAQAFEVLAGLEPQQRSAMALFMVQDFVSPKKCRWCKGRKEVKNGGRLVECGGCSGTGVKLPSVNARAKACGIPESTWRHKGLTAAYDRVMSAVEQSELAALMAISKKAS